jgi:YesN/AraC family two-component response regulator
MEKVLYGNNPRVVSLTDETLAKADLATIEKNYRMLFNGVKGATLIITGNVDLETLKPLVEKYFGSIPVLSDDSPIFIAVHTFAEALWGGADKYVSVDINREVTSEAVPFYNRDDFSEPLQTEWNIKNIELRYSYENRLMEAVEMGQLHVVEQLLQGFSKMSFESRSKDPVRNLKNYCIIMNTLMRKSAEKGGVHPLYIDMLSSDFAKRIESVTTVREIGPLIEDIFKSYCRYVRKYSTNKYSPPVQKAILHINADLNGNLSLTSLAERLNVSRSYLSDLFKKETGETVTEYTNKKRVKRATHLLSTTKLQVQTVAQHCGIQDINYFSKIFKKYTLSTPKEYRKNILAQIDSRKET